MSFNLHLSALLNWNCKIKWLLLLLATFSLFGCNNQNEAINKLNAQINDQKEQIKKLTIDVQKNMLDHLIEKIKSNMPDIAVFDPGNPGGYSKIDTKAGTFLVSLENVTPYLDGYRIMCEFGNITSATFNGFDLDIRWGARFNNEDKNANREAWEKSLHNKKISFTNILLPGTWNKVSFIVTPAKANEFGYIDFSMETNQASLQR